MSQLSSTQSAEDISSNNSKNSKNTITNVIMPKAIEEDLILEKYKNWEKLQEVLEEYQGKSQVGTPERIFEEAKSDDEPEE